MTSPVLGTVATGTEQSIDNSYTLAHTLAAGTNRVVEMTITAWRNAGAIAVSTVTYGGVTATLVPGSEAHFTVGATQYFAAKYYVKEADLPADGANNGVVTFTTTVDEKAMVISAYSPVNQTTPYGTSGTPHTGTDTGANITVTTAAGDWAITGLCQFTGTPTRNTGDLAIGSAVGAADATDCYTSYEQATGASTTVGWTVTSQDNVIIAVVLKAAAAAASAALSGAGSSTGTLKTAAQKQARLSAAGSSSATLAPASTNPAALSAAGSSVATASGAAAIEAALSTAASSTGTMAAQSTAAAALAAAGSCVATLEATVAAEGAGALAAAGSSNATLQGQALAESAMSAAGAATAIAEGYELGATPAPEPTTKPVLIEGGGNTEAGNPWRKQRRRDDLAIEEAELMAFAQVAVRQLVADHVERVRGQ